MLLGRPDVITHPRRARDRPRARFEVVYPRETPAWDLREAVSRGRARKGVDLTQATQRMSESVYFGLAMVKNGDADGVTAGSIVHPEIIRPALETMGLAKGVKRAAGMGLMCTRTGRFWRHHGEPRGHGGVQAELAEMIADAAKQRLTWSLASRF